MEETQGLDGNSSSTGFRPEYRYRMLEMPLFNGSDLDAWILKAERYFVLNQLTN